MQLDELAKIAQLPDNTLVRDADGDIYQVWRDQRRDPDTTWLHHFSDEYGAIVHPDGTHYAHSDIKLPLTVLEVRDAPDQLAPDETLLEAFTRLLNGRESPSNTPDFVLAEYLVRCLVAFEQTVLARADWYGHLDEPGRGLWKLDQLSEEERRYLAANAGYAADREEDPRYWSADPDERPKLRDRWREIARALHPDPYGITAAEEEAK